MIWGPGISVTPLGTSCQAAHQVELHRDRLAAVLDRELVISSTPFDWRIVGPLDIAAMIDGGQLFPGHPSALGGSKNRYWKARRCWFWHDKWDDFGRFTAKQQHLARNWTFIEGIARRVFVISDAQNNLKRVLERHKTPPPVVDFEGLIALGRALGNRFGPAELHFVTRNPRLGHGDRLTIDGQVRVVVHPIAADRSTWQGNDDAWGRILERIVTTRSTQ